MTIGECCETYELLAGFVAALEGELAASAPEVAKSMQEPVVLLRQAQAAYSELLSVVVQTAQAAYSELLSVVVQTAQAAYSELLTAVVQAAQAHEASESSEAQTWGR